MAALALPDDVIDWIAAQTGYAVLGANRIPGGGMREGWFIDVDGPDEASSKIFLRYSPEPFPQPSAFHDLATEAKVVRALGAAGLQVATVHAIHPTREAVLLSRVPGDTWFYRITDEAEQVSVAQDFIRNLAGVHRLGPAELDIPSLGPAMTAREHALERIEGIRQRATMHGGQMDPLVRLSADYLEQNIPDYDGPVVLVQGDTGPGNFLYQNGKVTAVLDWELCHWGDPMDDIAWLSLRTVQDTFTHLPDRLKEYEELSGHAIDERRVWYYRLFAETTMATLNHPRNAEEAKAASANGEAAVRDMGNAMLYTQLHQRLWLETLNELMGLGLQRPPEVEPSEAEDWHQYYGHVQAAIKTITPRISDPLALQWVKGVARMGRYLQSVDRDGRAYAELERDDIAGLIGHRPESLTNGRTELVDANLAGRVSDEQYVRYLWNKVMRDDYLMRNASGALSRRTWPPLAD